MKLPGIESAEVSLTKATAEIRLKPDNRVTLPQLREVLKKNGYPTRDAEISGRGQIVEGDGRRVLDLLNGSTMDLAESAAAARLPLKQTIEIAGTSRGNGKGPETLTVNIAAGR
jgi:hypothetical protein